MVGNENKNDERSTILTIAGALFCLTTIFLISPIYFKSLEPIQTNGHTPNLAFLVYIPTGILLSLLSVFLRPTLSLLNLSKWISFSVVGLYGILLLSPFLYSDYSLSVIFYAFIFVLTILTGMTFIPTKAASSVSIIIGGIGVLIGIFYNVSTL